MDVSLIVAVAENDVIGKENGIPWYLPADLAHFKQTTMGHPIIMGRKTYESIGRALPGRYNVVITHQKKYNASDECRVVNSLDQALNLNEVKTDSEIFIIGGQEIYAQALPLAGRIYLTQVHTRVQGNKFFKFDQAQWQEVTRETHKADDKNFCDYEFIVLDRKK